MVYLYMAKTKAPLSVKSRIQLTQLEIVRLYRLMLKFDVSEESLETRLKLRRALLDEVKELHQRAIDDGQSL